MKRAVGFVLIVLSAGTAWAADIGDGMEPLKRHALIRDSERAAPEAAGMGISYGREREETVGLAMILTSGQKGNIP